jgi:hypothetical protein
MQKCALSGQHEVGDDPGMWIILAATGARPSSNCPVASCVRPMISDAQLQPVGYRKDDYGDVSGT